MATIVPSATTTVTPALKPSQSMPTTAQKSNGTSAPTAPRMDLEPIYTALKNTIPEHWTEYKVAVSEFILGRLDQDEFTRRIDPYISIDPTRLHHHNQLICAITYNCGRDPPEPGVAAWVSANDKPLTAPKPTSGDAAEHRLKTEVMQLPARDRFRLKTIQDDPYDELGKTFNDYHAARQIKIPDIVPTSAGGFNKTNWELEIRKHYTQPLYSETNEFPDVDSIQGRMVPICYEEGLGGGCANGCSEFLNIASEAFIKEALTVFLGRVRSNGQNFIKTRTFKRRLEREEFLAQNTNTVVQRNAEWLLPCEVDAMQEWRPLTLADLRVAVQLGESFFGQAPLIAQRMMERWPEADDEDPRWKKEVPKTNGVHPAAAESGVNGHREEEGVGDQDFGWVGATGSDRDTFLSVLDDCLAVGQ
ncbi:transcriptional co-activator [Eremomyces bilateralis CBS 781.70]|uniref:Transcriptional co-activator n=1 Tax=Eremomyces bilateralis CBS 781.70 TaxID=1392243 RepID=A0A6G1GE27_9PEZI|nr:transcriptional co-activator [Eremomyces bilateralis CBS 781.70]KAF1816140.1 transcriptional co-activator [Eremomyces bilateralis CBS 781.70]